MSVSVAGECGGGGDVGVIFERFQALKESVSFDKPRSERRRGLFAADVFKQKFLLIGADESFCSRSGPPGRETFLSHETAGLID